MITIRLLKSKDIDFVAELTKLEKWGYLPKDVRRCLELEPKGCFMAERDGKRVGHVFSISYGVVGWIGLLIVRQSYRGCGIGTALMETAMNYLRGLGVETIRLEAVPEAVALYQHLGFRSEFDSLRFCKEWKHGGTRLKGKVKRIRQIKNGELEELARFDAKCFGSNRLKVLQSLYRDFPQHCLVAKGEAITGYIMGRKTGMGYWLGPWHGSWLFLS
jgi:GNAT superfamily N-acetyltransferase